MHGVPDLLAMVKRRFGADVTLEEEIDIDHHWTTYRINRPDDVLTFRVTDKEIQYARCPEVIYAMRLNNLLTQLEARAAS